MLDAIRRLLEAGREALTPKKAEELARALVKEGQVRRDQAARLARDLATWSKRSSERFVETIRREVTRQISKSGMASKEDLEALKRRVRKLEAAGKRTPRTTTGTSARRKSGSSGG